MKLKLPIVLVSCLITFSLWAANAIAQTENRSDERPASKLSQIEWVAGKWEGEALGGKFEEVWGKPSGNSIMGMFKLVRDGEVVFYEFITIVEEDDTLSLRLKHFDKSLVGWEEKDKYVEFPFVSLSESELVFQGLRFKRIGDDQMQIRVKVKSDSEVQELEFNCRRSDD